MWRYFDPTSQNVMKFHSSVSKWANCTESTYHLTVQASGSMHCTYDNLAVGFCEDIERCESLTSSSHCVLVVASKIYENPSLLNSEKKYLYRQL